MHIPLLALHSLLRWVVLALGLTAALRGFSGWQGGRPWTPGDAAWGKRFAILFDIQFLVGLILYAVTSPLTQLALQDMGAAMKNPALRYWAVEHTTGMVIGLALAHIGRARIGKARTDAQRHRTAAIFFGLALVVVLVSIPWPMGLNARPLFRLP